MKHNNYKVNKTIEYNDTGEEIVILIPEKGDFFRLNNVGSEMFRMLKEGLSVEDITLKISEEYDKEESSIEKDVEEFLTQLADKNIINKIINKN